MARGAPTGCTSSSCTSATVAQRDAGGRVDLVELELGVLEGLAVLVDLLDLLVQGGLQVEAHHERGIVVAALEVEHLEGVRGARGKGVAIPLRRIGETGLLEHVLDGRLDDRLGDVGGIAIGIVDDVAVGISLVDLAVAVEGGTEIDLAGSEVDGTVDLGVDAAKVEYEHVIDEDPDVVIPQELEVHVLAGDLAIDGLAELRLDGHAQVMVSQRARIAGTVVIVGTQLVDELAILDVEDLGGLVEGEEAADAVLGIGTQATRSIIEHEVTITAALPVGHELREVLAHVVVEVTLVIDLE